MYGPHEDDDFLNKQKPIQTRQSDKVQSEAKKMDKIYFIFLSLCLGDFVKFEPVTLVPFEPKLIDFSLMTVKQIEWFNTYNELIVNKVRPQIDSNDLRTLIWIDQRTKFVSPALSNEVQKWQSEVQVEFQSNVHQMDMEAEVRTKTYVPI